MCGVGWGGWEGVVRCGVVCGVVWAWVWDVGLGWRLQRCEREDEGKGSCEGEEMNGGKRGVTEE